MKILLPVFSFLFCLIPALVFAQETSQSGDFTPIQIEQDIVRDIIIESNDIYVKIDPAYHQEEVAVRISDAKLRAYRTWADGQIERLTKIYRSNVQNKKGYTYRVNTSARFVEYWINDKLILHLERKQ